MLPKKLAIQNSKERSPGSATKDDLETQKIESLCLKLYGIWYFSDLDVGGNTDISSMLIKTWFCFDAQNRKHWKAETHT